MTFDWHGNDPRKMTKMIKRRAEIGHALNGSGLGSRSESTHFGITRARTTSAAPRWGRSKDQCRQ
jgi:hypothetical protein